VEVARGDIWWADLPDPIASDPGGTRPVLIVQANAFNRSRIATILVVVITKNERLATLPGNVALPPDGTGLEKPSVVNISQVLTADRTFLRERIGSVSSETMARVESGLKLVLGLSVSPSVSP
jgi:mRNA interferase MazF